MFSTYTLVQTDVTTSSPISVTAPSYTDLLSAESVSSFRPTSTYNPTSSVLDIDELGVVRLMPT